MIRITTLRTYEILRARFSESFSTRTELQPGGLPTVILSRSRRSRSTSWGSYKAPWPHGKNSQWSKSQRLFRLQKYAHTFRNLYSLSSDTDRRNSCATCRATTTSKSLVGKRLATGTSYAFCIVLLHDISSCLNPNKSLEVRPETKLVFASWMKLFRW